MKAKAGHVCDFCGRHEDAVDLIVTKGDSGPCICSGCIGICEVIVAEHWENRQVRMTAAERQGFEPWEYTERS